MRRLEPICSGCKTNDTSGSLGFHWKWASPLQDNLAALKHGLWTNISSTRELAGNAGSGLPQTYRNQCLQLRFGEGGGGSCVQQSSRGVSLETVFVIERKLVHPHSCFWRTFWKIRLKPNGLLLFFEIYLVLLNNVSMWIHLVFSLRILLKISFIRINVIYK